MKFELKPRDRRALILLGVAAGLYFLVAEVLFPAYDRLQAAEASALEKENQLLRYRRAMARAADYTALLDEARGRIAAEEARLIPGENVSLASSELQTLVEAAAEGAGIELGQRNLSQARPLDDYFNEIGISLVFRCMPGQLVQFLSDVRNLDKFVTIRSIQVSPVQGGDGPPAGELSKDVNVNVTLGAILAAPPREDAAEPDGI